MFLISENGIIIPKKWVVFRSKQAQSHSKQTLTQNLFPFAVNNSPVRTERRTGESFLLDQVNRLPRSVGALRYLLGVTPSTALNAAANLLALS